MNSRLLSFATKEDFNFIHFVVIKFVETGRRIPDSLQLVLSYDTYYHALVTGHNDLTFSISFQDDYHNMVSMIIPYTDINNKMIKVYPVLTMEECENLCNRRIDEVIAQASVTKLHYTDEELLKFILFGRNIDEFDDKLKDTYKRYTKQHIGHLIEIMDKGLIKGLLAAQGLYNGKLDTCAITKSSCNPHTYYVNLKILHTGMMSFYIIIGNKFDKDIKDIILSASDIANESTNNGEEFDYDV